jgi:RimJ/RimL family protein N-acetyltransferase
MTGATAQKPNIELRQMKEADLEMLFGYQEDDDAAHMAAFVNEKWKDKDAYLEKWKGILARTTIETQTIIANGKIAGSVFTYEMNGEPQISYGTGKQFWGQGITTAALQAFLKIYSKRPIWGRVAFDNAGSIRVLEKCGFQKTGTDRYYSHSRKMEIAELVFRLDA